MLKQSTQVIQMPQPQPPQQDAPEDNSLAESVSADMLGNLVGIPGLGGLLDVIESQDNSNSQGQTSTQSSYGGIADLQKHALAQHMGSVVATVSEDTAKHADRAKARKHPNYIDIGAIFFPKKPKPVSE